MLDAALDLLDGQNVYFEPGGGNHGDTLIEMGSRLVLERRHVRLTTDAAQADAIVINGGGALGVELWGQGLPGLYSFGQGFRRKPLVILPSSFYFADNHAAAALANRSAPAYLFARDRYSLARLQTQLFDEQIQLGSGDDMAFALRGSPWLAPLRARAAARHILLVERFDVEAITAPPGAAAAGINGNPLKARSGLKARAAQSLGAPNNHQGWNSRSFSKSSVGAALARGRRRAAKQWLPGPIKRAAKRVLHRRRTAASGFTSTTLERLYSRAPQYRGLPVMAQDISSPVGFTFSQFVDAIVNAAVVITTRLHVGILAALLDKPTYLVSGGARYPKLQGVYEYSMADLPHVQLW